MSMRAWGGEWGVGVGKYANFTRTVLMFHTSNSPGLQGRKVTSEVRLEEKIKYIKC
jgi:hypothetical protein